MDPATAIGLAASVQQMLISLFRYARDVKDMDKDIRQLSSEVALLKAALEQVKLAADSVPDFSPDSKASMAVFLTPGIGTEEMSDMLASTEHLLEGILNLLQPQRSESKPVAIVQQAWRRARWHLDKKKTQEYVARVERAKSWFILAFTTDDAIQCREIYSKICSIEENLLDQATHLENKKLDDLRKSLSSWLAPYDSYSKYTYALEHFQRDTGVWFTSEVDKWMTGKSTPILWLKAKPGFGKTTLMSAAVERALEWQSSEKDAAVAYSFCSFAEQQSQDPKNVLGSLIAQLCNRDPSLWLEINDRYPSREHQEQTRRDILNLEQLLELLYLACEQASSNLILVDAVNESKETEALLECFKNILDHNSSTRILFSSTPETETQWVHIRGMANQGTVKFTPAQEGANSEDIKRYIGAEMENRRRLRQLPIALKAEITCSLCKNADGVFRWAQCQLDHLSDSRRTKTIKDIKNALQSLPAGLEQTYDQILKRIVQDGESELVKLALFWLCFAVGPMTLLQLAEAVIIPEEGGDIDEEARLQEPHDLIRACTSLISSSPSVTGLGSITLGHSSVKDYLTSDRLRDSSLGTFHMDSKSAHERISKLCLHYLLRSEFASGRCISAKDYLVQMENAPLLGYMYNIWDHVYLVDPIDPLRPLILRLLETQQLPRGGNFGVALQAFYRKYSRNRNIESTTCLYLAARTGNLKLVRLILAVEGTKHLETQGGRNACTPLHVASYAGHVDIVKELLAAGGDPLEYSLRGETGLMWARVQGHTEIVQLLVEAGARPMKDVLSLQKSIRSLKKDAKVNFKNCDEN